MTRFELEKVTIQETEWNKETACYYLGHIDTLYAEKFVTKDEWNKLYELVPLGKEDMTKINF